MIKPASRSPRSARNMEKPPAGAMEAALSLARDPRATRAARAPSRVPAGLPRILRGALCRLRDLGPAIVVRLPDFCATRLRHLPWPPPLVGPHALHLLRCPSP